MSSRLRFRECRGQRRLHHPPESLTAKTQTHRSRPLMRLLSKLDGWARNVSHRFLGFLEERLAPLTLMILVAVLTLSLQF